MSQIVVDKERCKKDGACVAVCPSRTLALDENRFPVENPEGTCTLCGHCVAVCSCDAIRHTGVPEEACLPMPQELPSPELMDGLLKSRRSTREFKDRPVSREVLEALLDVGRRAPTAVNSQKLHWIVVNGKAKVHALSAAFFDGPLAAEMSPLLQQSWKSGYDYFLRSAPTVLAVCAPEDYPWGREDGTIALSYVELAAEARGLGVCWAGYMVRVAGMYKPLRQMLAVPEGYVVRGGLMLGESKYTYQRIPPRKPLSVQWQ